MGLVHGVEELTKVAETVAALTNIGYRVAKGSYLALFEVAGPLNVLRGVNFEEFRLELSELDPSERETVELAFDAKLDLADDFIEKKIEEGVDIFSDAVGTVEEFVRLMGEGRVLLERVKALVGV